jgi:hypothetical protein
MRAAPRLLGSSPIHRAFSAARDGDVSLGLTAQALLKSALRASVPSGHRQTPNAEPQTPAPNASMLRLLTRPVLETRKLFQEGKRYIAGRTITLLGNDQIGFAGFFLFCFVVSLVIFGPNQ